jgi:tRNA(Ile)-lysidine synthase
MSQFESRLADAWPPGQWRDVTVVLAVSGGPDSVALARALAALAPGGTGRLVVAHYNHGLRGDESDADERFVIQLARQLDLECRVGRAVRASDHASSSSESEGDSAAIDAADVGSDIGRDRPSLSPAATSEENSRSARYAFLVATAQELGARYVAVAHTADDQAETVLHHIVRGTGLAGLTGMARARELAPGIALVRPLLAVCRYDVIAYLTELKQPYREDSSNQDRGYTRNRLRHELLPLLATDYNPRIADALLRLASLAREAQAVLAPQLVELTERCVLAADSSRILIDTTVLSAAPRYLVRETLISAWRGQGWPMQAMGFEEWQLLAALATDSVNEARSRKRVLPGEILAEWQGDRLVLSRAGSRK